MLAIIPKTRKLGAAVLVAVLIGAIITSGILKPLIMRPRPCDVNPLVPMIVDRPHGSSFPSGHATAAFAAFGALLFSKGPKPLVIVVGIGAVLMFVGGTGLRWFMLAGAGGAAAVRGPFRAEGRPQGFRTGNRVVLPGPHRGDTLSCQGGQEIRPVRLGAAGTAAP